MATQTAPRVIHTPLGAWALIDSTPAGGFYQDEHNTMSLHVAVDRAGAILSGFMESMRGGAWHYATMEPTWCRLDAQGQPEYRRDRAGSEWQMAVPGAVFWTSDLDGVPASLVRAAQETVHALTMDAARRGMIAGEVAA